ncbi:unnamed protein product [Paramecium sonneborni]|uniref:Uncharacterized protein n=1 Tax=Paramecium sonneborni TaxID=65129 RepID=A0A8S1N5G3_9CILI|nr:unnamed protein product [Paramecium sonneborni]CAD8087278.1 unnamed protein product [Paramecium sonneborni]
MKNTLKYIFNYGCIDYLMATDIIKGQEQTIKTNLSSLGCLYMNNYTEQSIQIINNGLIDISC